MSTPTFKAISSDIQQVGKHLKATKKSYIWKFNMGETLNTIQCNVSIVTGKIRLTFNGKILADADMTNGHLFQYSFVLDGYCFLIIQQGSEFQLRVNSKSFNYMVNQHKNQAQFKNHQQEDIKVNENLVKNNEGRMITLNIGAIGNGMKKKKNIQTQNWKQIGQEGIQYFKKLHQSLVQANSESSPGQNLVQSIQITPEEFNTMQQLFATQAKVTQNSSQSENKQDNAMNLIDNFNTMQKLFATNVNIVNQGNQNQPNSNKDANKQEFSTMQQLFATQQFPQKTQNTQSSAIVSPTQNDFNTMQNLFQTLQISQSEQKPQQKNVENKLDFHTMQQLFQTIQMKNQSKQTQESLKSNTSQKKQDLPNLNDFNTMQNLFATKGINFAQMAVTLNQQRSNSQNSPPPSNDKTIQAKQQDFNTMQNLFMTKNPFNSEVQTSEQSALGQLNNINNINMSDFNTMQNLFRTMNNGTSGNTK